MIAINYPLSGTKIYRFKIVGNYDDGTIGSVGDDLDDLKTKILICEDAIEAADPNHPRYGIRYIVLRPQNLWNAEPPNNFIGATDNTGDNAIFPLYSLNHAIYAMALFDESSTGAIEIASDLDSFWSDLTTYLSGFQTGPNNLFNWGEINDDGILKCYFVDMNLNSNVRGVSTGNAGLVWL